MEPPLSMGAEDLQDAREAVIAAFRPLDPSDVVLGQYATYRQTEGIAPDSTTDTYVAARLWIDTDRWRDVPFVLRTGQEAGGQRPAGQPDLPAGRRDRCTRPGRSRTCSPSTSRATARSRSR